MSQTLRGPHQRRDVPKVEESRPTVISTNIWGSGTAADPDWPMPCDTCMRRERCMAGLQACEQLFIYTRFGGAPIRWGLAPRQPSKGTYERILARLTQTMKDLASFPS